MKDTIITAQQKKREIIILFVCFIGAFIFNIVAVLLYKSPFKELLTQLHIVILVTFFFYFVVLFLRIIGWLLLKLTGKKKTQE